MLGHHPNENTLLEYSAGTLDTATSICVSTHINHCAECRNRVKAYNKLGGDFLSSVPVSPIGSDCFEQLMDKIKLGDSHMANPANDSCAQSKPTSTIAAKAKKANDERCERVINKLLNKNAPLQWKRVSPSLSEAVLTVGQNTHEVCFHKIRRGGRVAQHDHGGAEITVVLEGSFSDEDGTYQAGDYIERQPGEIHRPIATQNEDCLCLTVVEAPVELTGIVGKIVNPFISFRPR